MNEERCDVCGFPLVPIHCKLVCRNCGFRRDCSDPLGEITESPDE